MIRDAQSQGVATRFSITSSRGIPSQEFTPDATGAARHENHGCLVMPVWF